MTERIVTFHRLAIDATLRAPLRRLRVAAKRIGEFP
jgi:hypothetical protein